MKHTATQLNQMKKNHFNFYINTFYLMSGTGWIKKNYILKYLHYFHLLLPHDYNFVSSDISK